MPDPGARWRLRYPEGEGENETWWLFYDETIHLERESYDTCIKYVIKYIIKHGKSWEGYAEEYAPGSWTYTFPVRELRISDEMTKVLNEDHEEIRGWREDTNE